LRQPQENLLRCFEIGVAGSDEGDEAGAAVTLQLGEAAIDARLFAHAVDQISMPR
jgi:hypothetical protein